MMVERLLLIDFGLNPGELIPDGLILCVFLVDEALDEPPHVPKRGLLGHPKADWRLLL